MLSAAANALLTRTGPGTAMGDFFRRFWQPVALSREVGDVDGAPIRVRIMGEDFVAFRDTTARVGLVDPRCVHRGANLGGAKALADRTAPAAARDAFAYTRRSGSFIATADVPFDEVMRQRFGDRAGRQRTV